MNSNGEPYDEVSQIVPHLYLTSLKSAEDRDILAKYSIDAILSIINFQLNVNCKESVRKYRISLRDLPHEDALNHFPHACEIIGHHLKLNQNVLVHCAVGVSRSASMILAYLMKHNQWTYFEALNFVRSKRPCVGPNQGFQMQLHLWAMLGYRLDLRSFHYRAYLYSCYVNNLIKNRHSLGMFYLYQMSDQDAPSHTDYYKCRRCSRFVIDGHSVYRDDSRLYAFIVKPSTSEECYGTGKINCSHCQAVVGKFDWRNPTNGSIPFKPYVDNNNDDFECHLSIPLVHVLDVKHVDHKTCSLVASTQWPTSCYNAMLY